MTKYRSLILAFLLLASLATLFPPFHWGEEKLRTEAERRRRIGGVRISEVLPIKKYAFLFGDSKREFQIGWDAEKNIPVRLTLERSMITTELLLEYFLAFVLAFIAFIIISLRKPRSQ